MGPFFYSKKDIPAKEKQSKSLSFLIFFLDIPPNATILFFVCLFRSLNLLIPKKFLFLFDTEPSPIKVSVTPRVPSITVALRLLLRIEDHVLKSLRLVRVDARMDRKSRQVFDRGLGVSLIDLNRRLVVLPGIVRIDVVSDARPSIVK